MIDPFDAALSEFIDTLPEDPDLARRLLAENAPFTGRGDLPEFAELATMLRAVPAHEPRPEWVAESKARLMSAPLLPPEKRGFTWLGTMFLPFSQLSFPSISLPRLRMPSPVFARAAMALVLIGTLASVAYRRAGQSPILQVTTGRAPVENAQQAIAATQEQVSRLADSNQSQVAGAEIQGTPRDVVLLSQQIDLADLAIANAPPADQPRLRSELQSAVRAVRFDGLLEGITNGTTLQVSGVAVQADPSLVRQVRVGQPVSLLVTVNGNGKLQAVQATPAAPSAPPSSPAPSSPPSPPPSAPSTPPLAPPSPAPNGGTAPLTSSANTSAVVESASTTASPSDAPDVAPSVAAPSSNDASPGRSKKWHDDGGGSGSTGARSGSTNAVSSTGNGLAPAPPPAIASVTTPNSPAPATNSPGSTSVSVTTSGPSGDKGSNGKAGSGSVTSAVAGATTGSSPASVTVSSSGSSGGGSASVQTSNSSQSSGSSSQSSSSSSHTVSVSASSNSSPSSSGQQSSSSQSDQSSAHTGGQSAQVSRALAALQTVVSSAESHHKASDKKNRR
ncbi:MAG TPA: hypothetical protein VMW62_17285 [Chloroflexota bacterium]|nr:hypothetical protein [Chloroflexota bacterium]